MSEKEKEDERKKAVAEKMAALKTVDYLEDRARRGDRERILAVLARVPDVAPEPGDET